MCEEKKAHLTVVQAKALTEQGYHEKVEPLPRKSNTQNERR